MRMVNRRLVACQLQSICRSSLGQCWEHQIYRKDGSCRLEMPVTELGVGRSRLNSRSFCSWSTCFQALLDTENTTVNSTEKVPIFTKLVGRYTDRPLWIYTNWVLIITLENFCPDGLPLRSLCGLIWKRVFTCEINIVNKEIFCGVTRSFATSFTFWMSVKTLLGSSNNQEYPMGEPRGLGMSFLFHEQKVINSHFREVFFVLFFWKEKL